MEHVSDAETATEMKEDIIDLLNNMIKQSNDRVGTIKNRPSEDYYLNRVVALEEAVKVIEQVNHWIN